MIVWVEPFFAGDIDLNNLTEEQRELLIEGLSDVRDILSTPPTSKKKDAIKTGFKRSKVRMVEVIPGELN